MGFGNGYSVRHDRGSRRYDNSQVAHIWAQGDPDASGQSGNGNFFFTGRALWSYGSHFLVGYIMPDGVALINSASNSVSTSGHQSDARRAAEHRETFHSDALTDLYDSLRMIARDGRKSDRKLLRRELAKAANYLTGRRCAANEWQERPEGEQLGAYLARLGGLPATAWPVILRERQRLDAKAAKEAQAKEDKRALELAIHYADMSDSDWREYMRKDSSKYESFYAREATRLYHAGRLAKAKGFSAKRRAILKHRRADALRRKAGYNGAEASYRRWQPIRHNIELVRSFKRQLATSPEAAPPAIQSAAARIRHSLSKLAECQAFPVKTQIRLDLQANELSRIVERMQPDVDAYHAAEKLRREAEAAEQARLDALDREEKIAAWHAGADVRIGRYTFDAESGGAAIRIKGDQLETSHGASVPLEHAIKAFRFVKLVRQRGTPWERNGKTIRVGHFQIDRISAEGDFTAGCHNFTWPEIERAAALAGVADATPDDSAAIPSGN